jgi:hypothetical protein
MANIANSHLYCIPFQAKLLLPVKLNSPVKSIIGRGIISYNSPKLSYNAIVLKDWKKNCKLVFPGMATYLLESKKGLLSL